MAWFKGNRRVKHWKLTQVSAVESLERRSLLAAVKFYAVDDPVGQDSVYKYDDAGTPLGSYGIENKVSRGIATVELGDTLWVVDDGNKRVFVYDNNGALLGSWLPYGLRPNSNLQGIATDGTNIWLLARENLNRSAVVYFYANAASLRSGSATPQNSPELPYANRFASDLVFGKQNGTHYLWVVNNHPSGADSVRRYEWTFAGNLIVGTWSTWQLNAVNSDPTGITLDPSNGSMDIWISDISTDRVYRYANGRILTNPTLTSSFPLATGNGNVQGIADPPPLAAEMMLPGYRVENVAAAADGETLVSNRVNSPPVNRLEFTSGTDTNGSLISSSLAKGSAPRTNNRRRPAAFVATAVPRSSSPQQATHTADVDSTTELTATPLQLDVLFSDLQNVGWN